MKPTYHPVISATGLYTPAESISNSELVESFNAFVERVLDTALIRVYLFGNYDKAFAKDLTQTLQSAIPEQRTGATEYIRERVHE